MSIIKYLRQVENSIYSNITNKLYREILEKGHVDSFREIYNTKFTKKDFEYLILNLSKKDKYGLRAGSDSAVNKFDAFDIALKSRQHGYAKVIDFIDYDKGIVYIFGLKEKK